ncbi:ArsR/SmtB family transcription factor [Streptomyces sp. 7N604]|uniref:ArsR/SmtB family transcription factor n=1 Tax=Streptomyces sp. 7N604 TaxID=3457415 RepID=UPI003FD27D05
MPFHIRFAGANPLHCRFAVSPLWEVREAVRTIGGPLRHSSHLPWLRRVRTAAAGLDLRPLWLLLPERGRTPDFLCPPPGGPVTTIDDELAYVRNTAPGRAYDDLSRTLAETPGAAGSPRGRAVLADPGRAVRELADLLELAWKALIAPDWPWLRGLLEADIAFHSQHLADGGPERLFRELHPRLSWSGGTLTIRDGSADGGGDGDGNGNGNGRDNGNGNGEQLSLTGGSGLVLLPSIFVRPDVVGGFEPPPASGGGTSGAPTVVYPARGTGGLWAEPDDGPHEALAALLGRGRASVLAALAEPATTTALARRLGLAPSSVSAHLSALRRAGLLTSHRLGHQVLYERTPLGIALQHHPGAVSPRGGVPRSRPSTSGRP